MGACDRRKLAVVVHDHDPLDRAHLCPSLSLDTLPAGRHIQSRLRQPRLWQPHAQPQTRLENLPVLFQPQGPAVSNRDHISDPMDKDPLTRLSLSLDHSSTCSGNIQQN
ncbi:hypothetical protein ACFX1R_027849 [Malus domestica]